MSPGGWFRRAGTNISSFYKYYSEPVAEKLLPDPLPEPYNRPYTLVINLNDTLVHMDWKREYGWRAAKRPGIDYFIAYLSQLYEIVVFTSGMAHNAAPVLDKLDPYGYIMYRLYRDSTRYENGKYVKDLKHLNRDLSKVVVIDVNPEQLAEQPDNLITLSPWTGDANDSTLLDIIPFLETLALSGVDDVRPVLKSYQGKDIARTFADWQRQLRADWEEKRRAQGGGAAGAPRRGGFLGRLLGGAAAPVVQNAPPNPFEIIDAQTKEMREQFLKDQEQFRKSAEEQRKAQIEEMERQMREMKEKKMSLVGWFQQQAGGPQPGQGQ
ncbi:HAD-like domain-containing protein [Hyaloraphidium curvatum]|nr:HAD-like domain-containing protein [Hyaloraphidium curvatum]